MVISLIVAMARDRVIGSAGTLPWHLPNDLRRFKKITLGYPIVMGRLTFESIGRPLPGRTNIVVTTTPDYAAPGCVLANSLGAALAAVPDASEVMVIGGHALFRAALPLATRIYLTEIEAAIPGDVFFPVFDRTQWREMIREAHRPDAAHAHPFSFVVLERIKPPS